MPEFDQAIASTVRLRNSILAEIILLILVYTVGLWVWRDRFALSEPSWYSQTTGTPMQMTPAGHWYLLVSLPIFQFVLLRWYYRLFLWFWFLFRVSRLNLRLVPTHPDKTGGIGFLGGSIQAFSPLLIAQGAALAGLIANQIFQCRREAPGFQGRGCRLRRLLYYLHAPAIDRVPACPGRVPSERA